MVRIIPKISVVILLGLILLFQQYTWNNFQYHRFTLDAKKGLFPPLAVLKPSSLVHFWAVLLGMRRIAADLTWIQILQKLSSQVGFTVEEKEESVQKEYPRMFYDCFEMVKLDPYFISVYMHGVGVLGWVYKRFDESTELARIGLHFNPDYYWLQWYLAATAYMKRGDYKNVILVLEKIITEQPDCPTRIKNILALIYEKEREYYKAKILWTHILETAQEQQYIEQAKEHLTKPGQIGYK